MIMINKTLCHGKLQKILCCQNNATLVSKKEAFNRITAWVAQHHKITWLAGPLCKQPYARTLEELVGLNKVYLHSWKYGQTKSLYEH